MLPVSRCPSVNGVSLVSRGKSRNVKITLKSACNVSRGPLLEGILYNLNTVCTELLRKFQFELPSMCSSLSKQTWPIYLSRFVAQTRALLHDNLISSDGDWSKRRQSATTSKLSSIEAASWTVNWIFDRVISPDGMFRTSLLARASIDPRGTRACWPFRSLNIARVWPRGTSLESFFHENGNVGATSFKRYAKAGSIRYSFEENRPLRARRIDRRTKPKGDVRSGEICSVVLAPV